jgi:hypothetical protein
MTRCTIRRAVALSVGLACLAAPVRAADPPSAPAVQGVIDCRKIAESAGRLTCYDQAVDAMAKAERSGDLVTIDRQQRSALRRQAFGFNIPSLNLLERDRKPAQDERIEARVAAVSRDTSGRLIIRLEDGAVWAQTDDGMLGRDPKPGSIALIRHGALGSFFMDFDGRPGFRATRLS